jgi:LAS superfamily LD-carboxypeptidase LdcB
MRGGKPIGAQISQNFDSMVSAAARDGVQLRVTSGKRSYQQQVALYNKYGPGRAARPGKSNHESGNAIDFTNTPGAFRWLKANASRFGFYNKIPHEPWHYSTTGR